jgi:hypothetical protein
MAADAAGVSQDLDAVFARLAARLLDGARAVAAERATPAPRRWRDARLLWPLFGKG